MNLLFIGDIFGRPGRHTVAKALAAVKEEQDIDLVIANAENIRHGKGVTKREMDEMVVAGVDFFTSGNHVFKDKTIVDVIDAEGSLLIRPANYAMEVPGRGYSVVETRDGGRVLVVNVMGRIFMPVRLDCPFKAMDKVLDEVAGEDFDAIFVDFHAEATSEKAALAQYLDGRVTAVIGTHTHVPTADARVLPGGTAFQSDVGFTGPINSIIGLESEPIIDNFLTQMPVKHEVAGGPTVFNAVKVSVDDGSLKATNILPIQQYFDKT